MVNGSVLNHRQLIRGLVKLCKEKSSGTLFLNLSDGNSARLVLTRGAISWMAYGDLRGVDAIEAMRAIDQARMNFNPALKLAIGKQELPSTADIIRQLSKRDDEQPTEDVPTVTEVVSVMLPEEEADNQFILPPVAETGTDNLFNQSQVHLVFERESMEYLGPMAKVLCEDYLKSMPQQLGHSHIRQLIKAFMRDINDDLKGEAFKERVKQSLDIP